MDDPSDDAYEVQRLLARMDQLEPLVGRSARLREQAAARNDESVRDNPTRAEMDARLGQGRAESAVQFEQLRGDIRELKASSAGKATIIITAVALFAAITSVLIGLSMLGWQGFGLGMSAHDMAVSAAKEALAHH